MPRVWTEVRDLGFTVIIPANNKKKKIGSTETGFIDFHGKLTRQGSQVASKIAN